MVNTCRVTVWIGRWYPAMCAYKIFMDLHKAVIPSCRTMFFSYLQNHSAKFSTHDALFLTVKFSDIRLWLPQLDQGPNKVLSKNIKRNNNARAHALNIIL